MPIMSSGEQDNTPLTDHEEYMGRSLYEEWAKHNPMPLWPWDQLDVSEKRVWAKTHIRVQEWYY